MLLKFSFEGYFWFMVQFLKYLHSLQLGGWWVICLVGGFPRKKELDHIMHYIDKD